MIFRKKTSDERALDDAYKKLKKEITKSITASSILPEKKESAAVSDSALSIYGNSYPLPASNDYTLTDKDAMMCVHQLYRFLRAVGSSPCIMYGHQNDIINKAGPRTRKWSDSDTQDVTGSIAAVAGMDTLSLTGSEHGTWSDTAAVRVKKAAERALSSWKRGAIVTISCHMPNFQVIADRVKNGKTCILGTLGTRGKINARRDKFGRLRDGSTNFDGYTPDVRTGNIMENILEGKPLNSLFTEYLDLAADWAHQLANKNVPVIFRPFHENTGGWFWWGNTSCTPELYKKVWQYTVHYLRDIRGVHNFLYAYSPGSENCSVEEYGERYPGDEWVDMNGLDMYHFKPAVNDNFIDTLKEKLDIGCSFSRLHNKLFALTETGIANPGYPVLKPHGNERPGWYNEIADAAAKTDACYFLLWANFSWRGGYYTPFVSYRKKGVLYGHEMIDSFVSFYNRRDVIFADAIKNIFQR